MRAGVDLEVTTVLVIAVVAHALGVMLLVLVGAAHDFHGLALACGWLAMGDKVRHLGSDF